MLFLGPWRTPNTAENNLFRVGDVLFLGPWRTPNTTEFFELESTVSCSWVHGGPLTQRKKHGTNLVSCCSWVHGGHLTQHKALSEKYAERCSWVHGGPLIQRGYEDYATAYSCSWVHGGPLTQHSARITMSLLAVLGSMADP